MGESKGGGKGAVRNPSNYIGAAAARIQSGGAGDGAPRKRPRSEYEAPYEGRPTGKGSNSKGSNSRAGALRAKELGLELDNDALYALGQQSDRDAVQLVDQVADKIDEIKNVSKYIIGACARGLHFRDVQGGRDDNAYPRDRHDSDRPPAKRPRPSSALSD